MNKLLMVSTLATCLFSNTLLADYTPFDRRQIKELGVTAVSTKAPKSKKTQYTKAQRWYKECFLIEGKFSYFIPAGQVLSDVYGQGWIDYGLQASYIFPLNLPAGNKLALYSALNYLPSSGQSVGGGQTTHIHMLPLTVGLKYLYGFCVRQVEVDVYAALGMRYNWVFVNNESDYVIRKMRATGFGGVGELGAFAAFAKYFLINIFMDYSIATVSSDQSRPGVYRQDLNINGFSAGGGVGIKF